MTSLKSRLARGAAAIHAFIADYDRIRAAARARHHPLPRLAPLGDLSLWALGLLRTGSALRALCGSAFGTRTILRVIFHIDVWSDAIGPGLRLPHPFGIVIGDGVTIGRGCTLMHHVTIQRGTTDVGDGVTLTNQVTVLAGSRIGERALIGAHSVVRGSIPAFAVAVGSPARVLRIEPDAGQVSRAEPQTASH